jgi:hypothetical protein
MADMPDRPRTDPLPMPGAAPEPRYGRTHNFGVARDLELFKQGALPPRPTNASRRASARALRDRRPGPRTGVRGWVASREVGPSDLWHRAQCRLGRHEMRGGHQMQLGSRYVHVERRCQWCGATPTL